MKLRGKRALITGASQGLGKAIAEAFLREGADLFLCARTPEILQQTGEELNSLRVCPEQKISWQTCDVADENQVNLLVEKARMALGGIDILVNNAGQYGPKGPSEQVDWSEWRRTLEVNLFGVMLPCRAVAALMKAQGGGKILNLSGGGATSPLPFITAYAASKAAVVRLTETLAEEWRPDKISVNAIAPGGVNTRMLDEVLAAGPEKVGADYYARALQQRDSGGVAPEVGAQLCVYLASAESEGITGKLISAPWDDWPHLHEHLKELQQSDVYTLRRILPKERGFSWGEK